MLLPFFVVLFPEAADFLAVIEARKENYLGYVLWKSFEVWVAEEGYGDVLTVYISSYMYGVGPEEEGSVLLRGTFLSTENVYLDGRRGAQLSAPIAHRAGCGFLLQDGSSRMGWAGWRRCAV